MISFSEVPAGSTLPITFSSYGKTDGESITMSGLAVTDIEVYKGTSMTQRASDNGYTLLDSDGIDIDGITGVHGFSISLSDNSDSGFYAVGSFYNVIVSTITIDGQTISFIAATFRIRAAEDTAGYPKVTLKTGAGTGEVILTSGIIEAHPQGQGWTRYVAPTAMGTMTLSSPSATFTFAAKSTGTAASTEGNGTKTIVVAQGSSEGTAYNTGTDVLTVTINISGGHSTVAALRTVINAGSHFTAFPSANDASTITTSTTGSGSLSGGVDCSDSYSGLSKTTPLASVGAAHTAASAGDTIWLNTGNHADSGTSTPFCTLTKDGLTIRGESQSLTIINDCGLDSGVWTTGLGCTISNLKVVGTNPGDIAVQAAGDWTTVEDCDLSTPEVGLNVTANYVTARRVKNVGGRYGLKLNGDNFYAEQCTGSTTSTFTFEANSNFAGIYIGSGKSGILRNCIASAVAVATTSSGKLIGVSANEAHCILDGVRILALNLSSNLTGGTYGITNLNGAATVYTMHGGSISVAGSTGTAKDIDASVSGSNVWLDGVKTDSTLWVSASNIHRPLESTDARYTLDVASTGEAGLDFNNIKDATGAHTLTNITVPVTAAVTGLTASDVGAIKTKTDFLPSATAGASGGVFIAGTNAQATVTSGFGANSITATSLAADTITDAKVASDVTIASVTGAVGSVTGSVGSLASQAKADVNAEVASQLNTAIPGSPTAGSLNAKIKPLTYTVSNKVDATAEIDLSEGNIDDIAAGIAGAIGVDPANVDPDHTWHFDSPLQTTAPNTLSELIGFIGLLSMDFTEPLPNRSSIASVSTATFANISGTEPVVTSSTVTANKKGVNILIDCTLATSGTYTLSQTVVTTDSQTFVRKGRLTIS